MGPTEIIMLITALFQMPGTILEFVKLMKKVPQENHQDVLNRIREESNKFSDTGRPTWD